MASINDLFDPQYKGKVELTKIDEAARKFSGDTDAGTEAEAEAGAGAGSGADAAAGDDATSVSDDSE